MDHMHLRTCRFQPYRKGMGPTFILQTADSGRVDSRGCTYIAYSLRMKEPGKPSVLLFEGEDFAPGMGQCDDSDDVVAGLMGFLTLRPGDTDDEYFQNYTDLQKDYCDQHAESLSCTVTDRFGER